MKGIELILEKYFEGQTSLKEEEMLRKYFQNDDIPEHLINYKPVFNFFTEERKAKELENEKTKAGRKNRTLFLSVCGGIAASILLFLSIKLVFVSDSTSLRESIVYIGGVKYTEPEIVNSQVLNALENISNQNDDLMDIQIDILNSFNDL